MDTSNIYYKMCAKAFPEDATNGRALKTQDQLQEMLLPDPNRKDAWGDPMPSDPKDDNVFWLFQDFAENIQERKYSQQTGEQLWLAFVMKKRYNKIWDGKDWIPAGVEVKA